MTEQKRVQVLDSHMSYVEEGAGPAALFLHGNPTSSFIWRKVIPYLASTCRCIAPDLIGFGNSGKPPIGYRFFDHVRYLDAFLEVLGIRSVLMVAQDWGTALAFHYAGRFPLRVRGLAFMEFIRPMRDWDEFHQRPEARALFQAFRAAGTGERLILEQNVFIERVLPGSIMRTLSPEEMNAYRAPFAEPSSRKPILALPRELPVAGEPEDTFRVLERDHSALLSSTYPKLLFFGDPGALISPPLARQYGQRLANCETVELGPGAHYLQEDHGETIGRRLRAWAGRMAWDAGPRKRFRTA